jgi:hypothetical protein
MRQLLCRLTGGHRPCGWWHPALGSCVICSRCRKMLSRERPDA